MLKQLGVVATGNYLSKIFSILIIILSIRYMPTHAYEKFLSSILISTYGYQIASAFIERCYILDKNNFSLVKSEVTTILSLFVIFLCVCLSFFFSIHMG